MLWRAREHDWPADPVYVRKTADQSSTDGTNLTDVTGMAWAISAGGIYIIEFNVFAVSAVSTTGLVLSINGPASPTALRYACRATVNSAGVFQSGATAYDTALVATGTHGTTVPALFNLEGYLENGVNAGSLTLRMRTEADTSAATVMRGSWGRLTRVG